MRDFECMPLAVMPQAWDHPDWLWEIKYDGFRSLACVESGKCRLVSRKNIPYKAFQGLETAILATFDHDLVLDGEIVCLDRNGFPQFYDLLWHRAEPFCYVFDVLTFTGAICETGPSSSASAFSVRSCRRSPADFIRAHGTRLFGAAVERRSRGRGCQAQGRPLRTGSHYVGKG